MAVISFYTSCKGETGNTVSAISVATYLGITRNKKILFISTSLNDDTVKEAFWEKENKKRSGLFGPNTNAATTSGIEGLDRIIRSNRITPEIITDYTRVVLTNRLEILLGYSGAEAQYLETQKQYPQIVSLAAKCYDMVIIDIDKELSTETQMGILKLSDVIVATSTQKADDIQKIMEMMTDKTALTPYNTIIALGKYDDKLKYNVKNVTRTFSKTNEMVNAIPYNTLIYEAVQEGKIIDAMLKLLTIKSKDGSITFTEELDKLGKAIDKKQVDSQMKR